MSGHEETTADVAESTGGLQILLRFVTDRCVAARVDARDHPEWPPHPGRLYMALAAAFFETDASDSEKAEERAALDWLAGLPSPRIAVVPAALRTPITCYVPVNDALAPNKAMLQSAPGMPRSRQPREFPTVIPQRPSHDACPDVAYAWSGAPDAAVHGPALERLCRHVIRVGHSSSFVTAWTELGPATADLPAWEPTDSTPKFTCRVPAPGELERLQRACQAERIEEFAMLKQEIESTTGKAQAAAKKRFADAFGEPYKASVRPPEPIPPILGAWQGYALADTAPAATIQENAYFERDLVILSKLDGPTLDVERTLGLTQALRSALLAAHGNAPIPAWLSGHDPDGAPTTLPHAAFLALPFAGFPHADGHVMGLAIALPKGISSDDRARWLGPLLIDQQTGDVAQPTLKLWGRGLPDWTLQLEDRASPPRMLRNGTWTAPARAWASVTPVVLDRFPKASRGDERAAWEAEVTEIVKRACTRSGLPEPVDVRVGSTAFHSGVPRAWAKSRRGAPATADGRPAQLGEGFPAMPGKATRPPKPQVHVRLEFDVPVAGPVLVGAGRFQGYGLCLPVRDQA